MTSTLPHIHLIDDDAAFRNSLSILLESWQMLVREFSDGESYLAAECCNQADCILLDVRLPKMDGLTVLRNLRAVGCTAPVVIITGHGDVPMAVRAMRSGANDFLEKPFDPDHFIDRVRHFSRPAEAQDDQAPSSLNPAVFKALTPRERDVMQQVVAGHANKVIARDLGLSPRTVEIHRARVMEKTGAKNLSHLVRMALKAGIDPDGVA